MSLNTELTATYNDFHNTAPPEVSNTIKIATADIKRTYDPSISLPVGAKFPAFNLQNAVGEKVSSNSLLAHGPMLVIFYRGEWCPYCNLQLQHLQRNVDAMTAKGVTLIAITPELPDQSLQTTEKHHLKFQVLSDVGNKLARELGIVWALPDGMKQLLKTVGTDFKKRYGDESYEVPLPAVFLVDRDGVVRNKYLDADFTKRLEPSEALKWMDNL